MNESYILQRETLLMIENSTLFYPCSGNDLLTPIQLFSPFVTDFWFVDRGYFSPGHQDTKHDGLDAPADKQIPILTENKDYELIEITIVGPASWDRYKRDIEPCILTETYKHIPSKKQVKIHRRRGYGFSAFHKEIRSLGVFFYRGDSQGEGGSGNLWLASDHISEVCDKLVDGGLIVTDGSQLGRWGKSSKLNTYHKFAQYHGGTPKPKIPDEFVQSVKPFTDKEGRLFTCVGYAGQRYGPTLIWQMKKASQQNTSADTPQSALT